MVGIVQAKRIELLRVKRRIGLGGVRERFLHRPMIVACSHSDMAQHIAGETLLGANRMGRLTCANHRIRVDSEARAMEEV
jgi:2C-methyl-D-erythritol 2,4-cyclodiphosphate synthase